MNAEIEKIDFIGSFPRCKDIPQVNLPEISFWGRSNVGKSSLINYLCNRKGIAHTSSTPGKTQLFNLYKIDNSIYFMDLPGYGYAVASKKKKEFWTREIDVYLKSRMNLCILFLLIDISIMPQRIDIEKINTLGRNKIPFAIILTKSDKCTKLSVSKHRKLWEETLSHSWERLPTIIETSTYKKKGREEVLSLVNGIRESLNRME